MVPAACVGGGGHREGARAGARAGRANLITAPCAARTHWKDTRPAIQQLSGRARPFAHGTQALVLAIWVLACKRTGPPCVVGRPDLFIGDVEAGFA